MRACFQRTTCGGNSRLLLGIFFVSFFFSFFHLSILRPRGRWCQCLPFFPVFPFRNVCFRKGRMFLQFSFSICPHFHLYISPPFYFFPVFFFLYPFVKKSHNRYIECVSLHPPVLYMHRIYPCLPYVTDMQ